MPLVTLPWLFPLIALLAAGLVAGFAAGIFGIGGGFVVVPALFLVLPLLGGDKSQFAHVAIGTSAATIIVTSLRSLRSHAKRGAVEFEVLRTWAPWLILGDAIGVILANHFDGHVLTLVFAIGVLLMSVSFLVPRLGNKVVSEEMPSGMLRVGLAGGLGTFSSLLGIGGGTIAILVMTLCNRSIHRAIATAMATKYPDVIVMRTFSKIFGMAGLRLGYIMSAPANIDRMMRYDGGMQSGALPVTTVACGTASLLAANLIVTRRREMEAARGMTLEFLQKRGATLMRTDANMFMIDWKTKQAPDVQAAFRAQSVEIGRSWPIWPTVSRITVGSMEDMKNFCLAYDKVVS